MRVGNGGERMEGLCRGEGIGGGGGGRGGQVGGVGVERGGGGGGEVWRGG